MSGFWSGFIVVLLAVQVIGALWMLTVFTRARRPEEGETTGHTWDGDLREFNNPLPRWWLILFWATAVFTIVYLVIYPGLGSFPGVTGWSQTAQYEREVAAAEERYGDVFAAFADMAIADMARDPDAIRLGRNLYLNNCATCHGSDARGATGFPNLTDGEWLYGGSADAILQSIVNGRIGVMPALGTALGDDGTDAVVEYLLSLSGRSAADGDTLGTGRQKYMQFCSACHGPTGQGMPALGAPNLANDVWLHGGTPEAIRAIIVNGRQNQMPAQKDLLSEARIRVLAAYVISLGAE
jgi:cytochrome c oxidase cbb3-type subunit 3